MTASAMGWTAGADPGQRYRQPCSLRPDSANDITGSPRGYGLTATCVGPTSDGSAGKRLEQNLALTHILSFAMMTMTRFDCFGASRDYGRGFVPMQPRAATGRMGSAFL